MVRNDKGLTLIEVLASVAILAVAIMTVTFFFQQTSVFSRDNERVDRSIQITRTVMEELIQHLPDQEIEQLQLFTDNQEIDLASIREAAEDKTLTALTPYTMWYPTAANATYRLDVHVEPIPAAVDYYEVDDRDYWISDYFVTVRIVCENLANNRMFELEAMVEY